MDTLFRNISFLSEAEWTTMKEEYYNQVTAFVHEMVQPMSRVVKMRTSDLERRCPPFMSHYQKEYDDTAYEKEFRITFAIDRAGKLEHIAASLFYHSCKPDIRHCIHGKYTDYDDDRGEIGHCFSTEMLHLCLTPPRNAPPFKNAASDEN